MKGDKNTILDKAEIAEDKPELADCPETSLSDDEKIDIAAARVMQRHKKAFLELAK